tara:strand:- start:1007 stop:1363 length:357 start_codon:yes stop_codon:yes gene_type:complete
MKHNIRYFLILVSCFFASSSLYPKPANAGLNKYTNLDEINNWIIQRRYDGANNRMSCRAYFKGYGTWFGERLRINNDNILIYPDNMKPGLYDNSQEVELVKVFLNRCRKSIIYTPYKN